MERLLFVCTGNVCRSPMAEAVAHSRLSARGAQVTVASAGLLGPGRSTTRNAASAMARRDLDVSAHRSRALRDELAAGADLIVGLAREHVRAVVDLDPELFPRTFTLKEVVRRTQEEGRRRADEAMGDYLRRVAQGRRPWELAGAKPDEDIADPIGRPRRVYERCAAEIEALVEILVDQIWPAAASEGATPAGDAGDLRRT